jgi:probable FeS assembly SUF system protein SufT
MEKAAQNPGLQMRAAGRDSGLLMDEATGIELKRNCEAVQIPSGRPAVLPKGTRLEITQTLGGSFTVRAPDGLYSVAGKDADALGQESVTAAAPGASPGPARPAEETRLWEALRSCYDPEIPVNIVDLGLVYDLVVEPLPSGRSRVNVKMTLTAPGCGMGTYIAADAQQKLLATDGVEQAEVAVVWDPPWHPSMITAEGRKVLGLE